LKHCGLTLLFLSISLFGWSQSQVQLKVQSGKLMNHYYMLIPEDDGSVIEVYSDFKTVYFLDSRHVIDESEEPVMQMKKLWYDNEIEIQKLNTCDSIINKIRNVGLHNRTSNFLLAVARHHIGYDQKDFTHGLAEIRVVDDPSKICFSKFSKLNTKWFSNQLDRLDSIRHEKQLRQEHFEAQSEISIKEANAFIRDFSHCTWDFKSLLLIITKSPDSFLCAVNGLDENDFLYLKFKMKDASKEQNALEARKALADSETKTPRKKQLIRSLKKWRG